MQNRYTFKKIFQSVIFLFLLSFGLNCQAVNDAADRMLFGLTEALEAVAGTEDETSSDSGTDATTSSVPSCTTQITVSTQTVSLIEDGDVNSVYNSATDNFLTDTDVDGGTSWGYRSFQSCVILPTAFTGSVEIPVTLNNPYDTRMTIQHIAYVNQASPTVPSIPAASNPFPDKLVFTTSGSNNRQCFVFTRVNDAIRNTVVDAATITLGDAVMKNGSNEVVTGTYSGLDPCNITATVEDDEGPGIRVSNISQIMEEPGVATPNSGTFSVVLRTAPTANVTIGINDTHDPINANNREGNASPTTLTFTNGNFNTPQLVTVSSNDDLEVDGLKIYTIRTNPSVSADADYNGIKPRDVVVYNKDQSVPGYAYQRFDATTGTTAAAGGTINGFATDENNQMGSNYANFQIRLRSKPTGDVTLNYTSNCGTKCTILTPSLTFTTANWNTYQTFQVRGSSDGADLGNQDYNVNFTVASTDNTYSTTVTPPVFRVRSCDNDGAHLIQPCNFSGSPLGTTGSRLSGAEPSATTNIWLITKTNPGGTVTVPLSTSDATEGTVPANVTIDGTTYNTLTAGAANQIALTHVDDAIVDANQDWTVITAESTGVVVYNPVDIFARTTDNEEYFYVKVTGNTREANADIATVDVCLGANNPNAAITLSIACTVASDECGTLSTASIVFPVNSQVDLANASDNGCSNDAKRQTFTVQGFDDSYADGTQTFTVTMTRDALEANYTGAPATVVTPNISNQDNEPAGKRVFVTTSTFQGEMTAQGVLGADSNCNSNKPGGVTGTYKALISSNSSGEVNDRVNGGAGWPIAAGLHYYRCNSSGYTNCSDEHQRLFIAGAGGSFNPMGMGRDFSTTLADEFWTGMTDNLTSAVQPSTPAGTCVDAATVYRNNCHGFTYINCPTNAAAFFYGQIWKNNGAGTVVSSESICSASKKLICVEQ
ncbi:hypothetical protein [Leptospira sp. GIMC2001]|uniref:hypothetical protein n=1 Tax=Leptospira sp. GIMC2001 TaxID=1513297 RepID=UPI0004A5C2DA|nr:hypothetical protein [Leptospira sp. GIMC2001]AID56242.1 flagellar hook-length control protein FliK [Leptospira sp. GIMC2001]WCL48148.1 hypothetical protein O4O04_12600 [Leptospira sp. GIMC2001]